jgi:hypothetical protein
MKRALWILLLFGVIVPGATGQDSRKAVAVGPGGSSPSSDYVWVTVNDTSGININSVMIRTTNGTAVKDLANADVQLTGISYQFNRPYDIVGSPLHHRVFVSNQGTGTVTVVNSDTLKAIGVVPLANATSAKGMSLSEDESTLFIAGHSTAGPAVWRLSTTTLATDAAPIGQRNDATHDAEDCVVIRAANTGGTGNGPGKVYFSVQASGAAGGFPGVIGIIDVQALPATPPFPAPTFVPVQAAPLAEVAAPTNMDRAPDHSAVYVACTKVATFGADLRLIRINPLTDAMTTQVVKAVSADNTQNLVTDVSFATIGGVPKGVILNFENDALAGIIQVTQEIDINGVAVAGTRQAANQGALTGPLSVRLSSQSQQMFVGDIQGTGNGYSRYDATASPPTLQAPQETAVGARCLYFAVMPTPSLVVSDICPRAGVAGASAVATVYGAGFTSGMTVRCGGTTLPATFVDANTITVDFGGRPVGLLDILAIDGQNFARGGLDLFYQNYAPPPKTRLAGAAGTQLVLPSALQGYRMVSFPQYATLTNLKAALAAQLGPYNPVLYRVFFYRNGRYVEINQLADDGCDLAGESFWILTRNGGTLTLTDPDVRLNDGASNRVIPINPGFNMISLPQMNAGGTGGTMPWGSMRVTANPLIFNPAAPGGPVLVTTAQGLAIVEQAVELQNGAYILANNLIAGQGYWINNVTSQPAYLVFQPGLVTKPAVMAAVAGVAPPAGSMPPSPPSGGISESGSSCGLMGLEALLVLLMGRGVSRSRRLRRWVA